MAGRDQANWLRILRQVCLLPRRFAVFQSQGKLRGGWGFLVDWAVRLRLFRAANRRLRKKDEAWRCSPRRKRAKLRAAADGADLAGGATRGTPNAKREFHSRRLPSALEEMSLKTRPRREANSSVRNSMIGRTFQKKISELGLGRAGSRNGRVLSPGSTMGTGSAPKTPAIPLAWGPIEMRERPRPKQADRRVAKELSLETGCYVDTRVPSSPIGGSPAIKLLTETEFFEAAGPRGVI